MSQKIKKLYQLVAKTFAVSDSGTSVSKDFYSIDYKDKQFGKIKFVKHYDGIKESWTYLRLGNVNFFGSIKDNSGLVLAGFGCGGLVDKIEDFYGAVYRSMLIENEELKQRFAKADKIFASFTSKGKLADLIKRADAKWKEKYDIPREGDTLDHYLN